MYFMQEKSFFRDGGVEESLPPLPHKKGHCKTVREDILCQLSGGLSRKDSSSSSRASF